MPSRQQRNDRFISDQCHGEDDSEIFVSWLNPKKVFNVHVQIRETMFAPNLDETQRASFTV